jgi:hypothetical protein
MLWAPGHGGAGQLDVPIGNHIPQEARAGGSQVGHPDGGTRAGFLDSQEGRAGHGAHSVRGQGDHARFGGHELVQVPAGGHPIVGALTGGGLERPGHQAQSEGPPGKKTGVARHCLSLAVCGRAP